MPYELIKAYGLLSLPSVQFIQTRKADEEEVAIFHSRDYLAALRQASEGVHENALILYGLGPGDNPIFQGVYDWSLWVTGATLQAGECVANGKIGTAFNIAGGLHHAQPSRASGFCYINDVVVGISKLIEQGKRVVYIDIDPQRTVRPPAGDRDMGTAVIVGVGFLALALVLFSIGPAAAMILVTAVIGLGGAALYGVLRKVGYEPVTLAGIVGCVGLALGAYNYGSAAIPTVLFLTTAVSLLWFLVGAAHEAPVMNVGVTLLGVLWVGLFGSFAALMLALPPMAGLADPGTGILLAAILGTVGYDVGGLFIGKNAGRQPLSPASPNKTVEGLIGGCVVAVVVVAVGSVPGLGPIDTFSEGLTQRLRQPGVGFTPALCLP